MTNRQIKSGYKSIGNWARHKVRPSARNADTDMDKREALHAVSMLLYISALNSTGESRQIYARVLVRFRQGVFVAGMASLHQSTASQQLHLDAVRKMTAVMPAREHVDG